jgi:hypothetical protein
MIDPLLSASHSIKVASDFIDINYALAIESGADPAYIKEQIAIAFKAIDKVLPLSARIPSTRLPVAPPEFYEIIMQASAAHYGVTMKEMKGKDRTTAVVEARMIASMVSHDWEGIKTFDIAMARAQRRDHSTVLHHLKRFRNESPIYPALRNAYQAVYEIAIVLMERSPLRSHIDKGNG